MRTVSSNGWWRIFHWTGTSCRRSWQKSSKASPAARAGALDPGGVRTERAPRGGADGHPAQNFALPQPAATTGRIADAAARTCREPSAVRLSQVDGDPEERGLAGESQADLSAVHRGRAHCPDQGTQEVGAARTSADAHG